MSKTTHSRLLVDINLCHFWNCSSSSWFHRRRGSFKARKSSFRRILSCITACFPIYHSFQAFKKIHICTWWDLALVFPSKILGSGALTVSLKSSAYFLSRGRSYTLSEAVNKLIYCVLPMLCRLHTCIWSAQSSCQCGSHGEKFER